MKTIVLNRHNLIDNGKNNTLVYYFPNSVQFKDSYVAVSQVSMYYSWYNISQNLDNNTFSYQWIDGTTFSITIPDGLYEISDVNTFLQSKMIENNHYLVNSQGNNVYYIELEVNATRYSIQINLYKIPTAAEASTASLSVPSGGSFMFRDNAANSSNNFNPKITIPANFHSLIGFDENFSSDFNASNGFSAPANQTYISKSSTDTLSYLSHSVSGSIYGGGTPDVQPNSSLLLNCSNVDNPYASPSGIIYSVVPNVAIGQLINNQPAEYSFNKLINGTYTELRIQFLGTDFNEISIQDPEMTILLVIKDKNEI
jgi:hypothetical protein